MCDSYADSEQESVPPELTREEINASVFEFDPAFEFDAPQWFDFCDIKSLYCYGPDVKTALKDGEWVNGEDWFSEVHEGHEFEYYDSIVCGEVEFGANEAWEATLKGEPLSPSRPASSCMSPTTPNQVQTPLQSRYRGISSALSPGTSKTDSPMRSGAVRLRPGSSADSSSGISSSQSYEAISTAVAKKSGPQRLIVQVSPTRVSPPSKPASSPPNTKTADVSIQKSGPLRVSPLKYSPIKSSKEIVVLPRYMDVSKPAHQTQLPPKAMISRNQGDMPSRVTQRRVASNVTKRHFAPTQTVSPPSQATSASTSSKSSYTRIVTENSPTASNQLLKQVDSLLQQQKAKPRPAYEPRRFGIKEIKTWEQLTGLKWHALSFEERQTANEQMDELRRTGSIQALSPS